MNNRTKDSYYFSHDSDARNDIKMIKLRRELGLEGYGIFWCLIEMLRASPNYRISLAAVDDIGFELKTTSDKVEQVINSYDLFNIEKGCFFSERLCNAMGVYNQRKQSLSEAGKKGMQVRWNSQAPPLKRLGE